MAESPKKILCIEDDRETAALVAEELTQRGFEVLIAYEGEEGFVAILKGIPDLVLCDISVPSMTGFEILARLNELSAKVERVPFLFITPRLTRTLNLRARRLGATDFVLKPIDFEILHAILDARLGGVERNDRERPAFRGLTDREIELLGWVARGRSSVEIAQALGIVKRTVDFHLENVCVKLGARNRTEAVAKAAFVRLIKP
jgi:DNA-binding NarL/FixJ family response regulator